MDPQHWYNYVINFRRDFNKESGRRRLQEDQGLLGLDPRGGGAGEVERQKRALQAHLHVHVVAADQQAEERHDEPGRLAHQAD